MLARRSLAALRKWQPAQRAASSSMPQGTNNVFSEQQRGPWEFKNFKNATYQSQTFSGDTRMRNRKEALARLAEDGRIVEVLRAVSRWKERPDFKVDVDIYNSLVNACSMVGLPNEARAFIADMHLMGIKPDINTFVHLLRGERFSATHVLHEVFDMIYAHGLEPDARAYHCLLLRYLEEGQLEMSLRILTEMAGRNVIPLMHSVHRTIKLACHLGFARMAVEIAREFERAGVRRLETETWMECLAACAEELYPDEVRECWDIIRNRGAQPHEGLLLQVLHTAARHGVTSLAFEVLDSLRNLGPSFQCAAYHLEPVVEACCQAGDLKLANQAIRMMRQQNLFIPENMPIFTSKEDYPDLDKIFLNLQDLANEGEHPDRALFNSLCVTALRRSEPQHALGYLRMASDLQLKLTEETYRILVKEAYMIKEFEVVKSLIAMARGEGIEHDFKPETDEGYRFLVNEAYEAGDTGDIGNFVRVAKDAGIEIDTPLVQRKISEIIEDLGRPRQPQTISRKSVVRPLDGKDTEIH